MAIALRLLILMIALAPAILQVGRPVAQSIVGILSSAMLAFIGVSASTADVSIAAQKTRALGAAAVIPVVWLTMQLLPMPDTVSHTIWRAAAPALGDPIWAHITVDIGITVSALVTYASLVSLTFAAVFLADDRQRAGILLEALSIAAALSALSLFIFNYAGSTASFDNSDALAAASILGVVLTFATVIGAFERRQISQIATPFWTGIGARIVLFGLCAVGLMLSSRSTVFAAISGVVIILLVQIIRRYSRSRSSTVALLLTALSAMMMIAIWAYDPTRPISPFLQFAANSSLETMSAAQRMLSDTGFFGNGAGADQAILPIYQRPGSTVLGLPTTASTLAIELGWPMTVLLLVSGACLAVLLFRAALIRRRDSFFSAAAAGCVVSAMVQAFMDASLLNLGIGVLVSSIVGVGFAQSMSRRQ